MYIDFKNRIREDREDMTRLNAYTPLRVRARDLVTGCQRESSVEKKLSGMLRKRGALCLKFTSPGHPGVPDRIVVLPDGRIFFVELKASGGVLSPLQRWQIEQLRSMGADVRILRGEDQVQAFVEEVLPA